MAKKEIDQATLDRYNKGYEVSYLNLDSIGQFKRRQAVKKAEKQNGRPSPETLVRRGPFKMIFICVP